MIDNKHVKLVGGSLKTAKHDLEKMKTAREANAKIKEQEQDRDSNRRARETGNDIDWSVK